MGEKYNIFGEKKNFWVHFYSKTSKKRKFGQNSSKYPKKKMKYDKNAL